MPKRRHEPIRTCVGCRQEGSRRSLIRLVRTPDGTVALDPVGRAPGRGAYLHRAEECVRQARRRRALERALRATVPETVWQELASGSADSGIFGFPASGRPDGAGEDPGPR
jgi:predicted RNA-binding protein YlxR (DUF448 family)